MEPEMLRILTATEEAVANEFLPHEEPAGVAIFLPGRGYGATQPPVYFLLQMLSARGYETLSLQYWYQVQGVDLDPEADPQAEEAGYARALEEARQLHSRGRDDLRGRGGVYWQVARAPLRRFEGPQRRTPWPATLR